MQERNHATAGSYLFLVEIDVASTSIVVLQVVAHVVDHRRLVVRPAFLDKKIWIRGQRVAVPIVVATNLHSSAIITWTCRLQSH